MTKKHEGYLLLVEDSLDQREAMQAALEIEGYHVIAVPGGQEALDHLRGAASPCLILIDLMMPGKNGWQFRAEQLEDPWLAPIPVLAVSGDGRGREKALELGIPESFTKPIDWEALLAVVADHC